MSEHRIQLGFGRKGSYHDFFVHGNPSIAQAYFIGIKVHGEQKFRLLNEQGSPIAWKSSWRGSIIQG